MFVLSFVLEDWAIHELVQSPRYRKLAATLVASSYVTWTYQTHTFSNSIETLAVLWTLVMIQRIREAKVERYLFHSTCRAKCCRTAIRSSHPPYSARSYHSASSIESHSPRSRDSLCSHFSPISRDSKPPCPVTPHLSLTKSCSPISLITVLSSALTVSVLAIIADTQHYHPSFSLLATLRSPTITPLNSLLYNSSASNLSTHGLHPFYQHTLINLPQLLGPALFLLPSTILSSPKSLPTISILSSLFLLSLVPHQEARFLTPLAPLCLSVIRLPRSRQFTRYWLAGWVVFNTLFAALMGTYHQGGVVPGQIWLGKHSLGTREESKGPMEQVFWWRTYPPPIYLLGKDTGVSTTDLMGLRFGDMQKRVRSALGDCRRGSTRIGLVAPWSSVVLDEWRGNGTQNGVRIEELWRWDKHLNLDDMDFAEDGVLSTLRRVIGRRGLVIWSVERICDGRTKPVLGFDW